MPNLPQARLKINVLARAANTLFITRVSPRPPVLPPTTQAPPTSSSSSLSLQSSTTASSSSVTVHLSN